MMMKALLTVWLLCEMLSAQAQAQPSLQLNGFTQWFTGHSERTRQLIPAQGRQALVRQQGRVRAHVKFDVNGYGELSFPIDPATPPDSEARKVDLSQSAFIRIRYKSNTPIHLQLRQTGVHGGVHPSVTLPRHEKYGTETIYFREFTGGKRPLDLSDVAKFNFAFLSNSVRKNFAELWVESFEIEGYTIEEKRER